MGKKKSTGAKVKEEEKARLFVLKVSMHCNCNGCIDKIRAAVKDITCHQGIESWDQSALESKGEVRLLATADPEKLRHRLHKATRKNVDLIVFPTAKEKEKEQQQANSNKDAAATQALLNSLQAQQNAWASRQLMLPGAWNAHPADPYAAVYPGVYPAAGGAWAGAYSSAAYPPAQGAYSSAAYPPAQGAYGWHHGHGY